MAVDRADSEALASLALLPLHAIVALVSALAFFPFALFTLLGFLFGAEKFIWFGIWCAVGALVCVRNMAAGFEAMNDPDWRSLAKSCAWIAAVAAGSPLWWR